MTDMLNQKVSRRTLLRIGGCAGLAVATGGVAGVVLETQTDLFDRLRGISHTPLLDNPDAWAYEAGTLTLDLSRIPDLAAPGSAVQLDDDAVPEPLLIVYGMDEAYYVFVNKCPHGDRKIDLHEGDLRCTSISRSTFDYAGTVLSGPADSPLESYTVRAEGESLVITLA